MTTDAPNTKEKYRQELRRRLRQFTRRTRQRVSVLTGREEIPRSDDPGEILRELLNNWPNLELLMCRHGASCPLIDKVRGIRNDVLFDGGTFSRSDKAFQDAMRSIGMLEKGIRNAGAEEGRRRKRKAEAAMVC